MADPEDVREMERYCAIARVPLWPGDAEEVVDILDPTLATLPVIEWSAVELERVRPFDPRWR